MPQTPKEAFNPSLRASHIPTQVNGTAVISFSVACGMWQIQFLEIFVLHIDNKGLSCCFSLLCSRRQEYRAFRDGPSFSRRGRSLSPIVNPLDLWFSPGDQPRRFRWKLRAHWRGRWRWVGGGGPGFSDEEEGHVILLGLCSARWVSREGFVPNRKAVKSSIFDQKRFISMERLWR